MTRSRLLGGPILAVAYIAAGWAGLQLAVPPGYATAIFPPAGIAVAAAFVGSSRTLPWVFLGSLLLNLWIGRLIHGGFDLATVEVASVIAAASAVQAAIGGAALRRLVGYPAPFDNGRDLSRFVLSAPVFCMTSATLSLAGMAALGAIAPSQIAVSWLNWWAGDTLGVLFFLPLVMVAVGEPRDLWRGRAVPVAVPMLLFFALFAAIFVWVAGWESASQRGQSVIVLMAGIFSTSLLGALLLLGSGQQQRVSRLLAERTRERDRIWQVSEDLLGVGNFEGYFTSTNPAWTRTLGWSGDEIKAMHVGELRHPDDAPAAIQGRQRLAAGVPTVRMENRFRRKDGTYRWIYWTMTAEDGLIYLIGRDTTADREAALVLRQTEERLRESERRFQRLVEGVSDYAIFTMDLEGRILTWNAGAVRIKGYTANEVLGENFARFFTAEDRAQGMPARELATALKDGKFEAETWRVRKDGQRFFASVLIEPLRDAAGEVTGFVKITRDATERLRQQETLARTREALAQSQKMEALGKLIGGVAHDFNNLLTAIQGSIDMVERQAGSIDPPTRARLLGLATSAAQRASTLTARLLAYSRQQTLRPESVDINRLVTGMSELLHRTLGERVKIETVLSAGLWRCKVDANQLESALLNLAINASDAMPDGGKLTIETGNTHLDERYAENRQDVTPGQYVLLAVSDSGVGMSAETMAHAFEPFFTTKGPGKGTGLGLSQVYGFVKQSGGHVAIYSEAGHGTVVKLYLPRYQGPEPERIVEPARPVSAANGETILVVEDDSDVRAFVASALVLLGYRVIEAADARTALAAVDENPAIALMLTDLVLPDRNGRVLADEACRRIPNLPVLYMTGYARNAIVHHGILDVGVNLLSKPFTADTLGRKIREVLRAKK